MPLSVGIDVDSESQILPSADIDVDVDSEFQLSSAAGIDFHVYFHVYFVVLHLFLDYPFREVHYCYQNLHWCHWCH